MLNETEEQASLTNWQKEQLQGLPNEGVECLLKTWTDFAENHDKNQTFCNSTYDGVGCWPFTPANTTASRTCFQVFKDAPDLGVTPSPSILGVAIRICTANGSWLFGNWTNYTECAEYIKGDDDENHTKQQRIQMGSSDRDETVVDAVRYILFIGSMVSFVLLSISIFLFRYFRALRCDRITVHMHLMSSLCLRFLLLIVITEPIIFRRQQNYRNVDLICKLVLSMLMYATVASVNWMFIQGHYLHGRLTTNIFDKGIPLKAYLAFGWGVPIVLIFVWAFVMETYYPVQCWENFGKHLAVWIIVGPMLLALFINLLFVINIVRILLTKIKSSSTLTEAAQFRRAVKATLLLFPLLGINNLLLVYNPGGKYEQYYMLGNTILLASQGILVSILYCFMSSDIQDAIKREYLKFIVRRNANSNISKKQRERKAINTLSLVVMKSRSSPFRQAERHEEVEEDGCHVLFNGCQH